MARLVVVGTLVGLLAAAAAPASASACDRYASPAGNDASAGTATSPWQTVARLISGLSTGETGCLLSGTYDTGGTLIIAKAGITLTTGNPAGTSTIKDPIRLEPGAAGFTISGLALDLTDSSTPGLRIEADDVTLLGNNIFNDTLPCVFAPLDADRLRVEGNRLHDCGSSAVSIEHGLGAVIVDNFFYDNPQRGVQLYPEATDTEISNNAFHNHDEAIHIGSDPNERTTDTLVTRNVLIASTGYHVVGANEGQIDATGNVVTGNCTDDPNKIFANDQFTASDNPTFAGNPYANIDAKNFALAAPGGACAGKGVLPGAASGAVTATAFRSATVTGTVSPHQQTAVWFVQYGKTSALGLATTTRTLDAAALPQPVSQNLEGLEPGTTYYWRVVAENIAGGRREGAVQTFATPTLPDRDADGVPDETDACPDAPRGAFDSDVNGCADDADTDKVPDATDACRTLGAGAFDADGNGCPDDTDGDGIPDERDLCRIHHRGAFDLDGDGCPNAVPRVQAGPVTESHGFFKRGRRRLAAGFTRLRLKVEEPGVKVAMRCVRACRLRETVGVTRPRTISFRSILRRGKPRRLPLRTKIEIRATKAGREGLVWVVAVNGARGTVTVTRRCLPPGAKSPVRC